MILGDDLVARAVVANGVAERDVEIQRQRLARRAVAQPVLTGLDSERFDETISGRIRGIARAVDVEATNDLRDWNPGLPLVS